MKPLASLELICAKGSGEGEQRLETDDMAFQRLETLENDPRHNTRLRIAQAPRIRARFIENHSRRAPDCNRPAGRLRCGTFLFGTRASH